MSGELDQLELLQKEFLEEMSFLLEACEESYLKLEDPACRPEELGKIFRLAHSMKGAGAAVGFTDLAQFAHIVEDCLSLMRGYPELVDTPTITVLLKAGDAFKHRIQMLKTHDPAPWDVRALAEEIGACSARIESSAGTRIEASPTPVVPTAVHSVEYHPSAPDPAASANKDSLDDDTVWKKLAETARESIAEPLTSTSKPTPSSLPAPAATAPVAAKTGGTGAASGSQQTNASIKIDADRVENVLNLVGELVVIKSQLMNQCDRYSDDLALNAVVGLMDKTIRELQDRTLSMRMTPLKGMFLKVQRVIRDLSVKLGKPVEFVMSGEDTEIDRTMVELLSDPLMHMARNSLDHGIEKPETRAARKKPEKGLIHLSAQQAGGRILVKIRDDGGGLNRERILKKAQERNLVPQDADPAKLSDKQIYAFIFMPGFSTADKITDISGRGVGMDVVKTNIDKLKGLVDIDSTEGDGSVFTISIPLTTSITDGMVVRVSGLPFIIPMDGMRELVTLETSTLIEMRHGRSVFNHRGRIVPVIDLHEALRTHLGSQAPDSAQASSMRLVLVEAGNTMVALKVDRILGQTQVVLKALGPSFQSTQGIAGAAILGDGKVALVLDPIGLVEFVNRTTGSKSRESTTARAA